MRRREVIALVGGAVVAWPFSAMAQQAGRTYRVGSLHLSPRNSPHQVALFDELRRHGFVEGQNLQPVHKRCVIPHVRRQRR
jgi:putative tryptophan/tyrosine transport system substrate-binding protein